MHLVCDFNTVPLFFMTTGPSSKPLTWTHVHFLCLVIAELHTARKVLILA